MEMRRCKGENYSISARNVWNSIGRICGVASDMQTIQDTDGGGGSITELR